MTHDAAISFHDRIASRYDDIYAGPYWDFFRAVSWKIWKGCLPRNANARVADLGCGTGNWGLKLAKSGYRVTFLDIAAGMLDVARRKAVGATPAQMMAGRHASPLLDRAEFVQADLVDLSAIPAGAFEFAVAEGDPISHASDPARALSEIRRILSPGGILAASVDNACAAPDFFLADGDIDGLKRFLKRGETEWLAHRREERYPIRMFTLALEMRINGEEAYLGRASHLVVVARKR
jgi:SAM-dependent methyltransferase